MNVAEAVSLRIVVALVVRFVQAVFKKPVRGHSARLAQERKAQGAESGFCCRDLPGGDEHGQRAFVGINLPADEVVDAVIRVCRKSAALDAHIAQAGRKFGQEVGIGVDARHQHQRILRHGRQGDVRHFFRPLRAAAPVAGIDGGHQRRQHHDRRNHTRLFRQRQHPHAYDEEQGREHVERQQVAVNGFGQKPAVIADRARDQQEARRSCVRQRCAAGGAFFEQLVLDDQPEEQAVENGYAQVVPPYLVDQQRFEREQKREDQQRPVVRRRVIEQQAVGGQQRRVEDDIEQRKRRAAELAVEIPPPVAVGQGEARQHAETEAEGQQEAAPHLRREDEERDAQAHAIGRAGHLQADHKAGGDTAKRRIAHRRLLRCFLHPVQPPQQQKRGQEDAQAGHVIVKDGADFGDIHRAQHAHPRQQGAGERLVSRPGYRQGRIGDHEQERKIEPLHGGKNETGGLQRQVRGQKIERHIKPWIQEKLSLRWHQIDVAMACQVSPGVVPVVIAQVPAGIGAQIQRERPVEEGKQDHQRQRRKAGGVVSGREQANFRVSGRCHIYMIRLLPQKSLNAAHSWTGCGFSDCGAEMNENGDPGGIRTNDSIHGRQRFYTIGRWDSSLTPEQAREQAEIKRGEVRQGIDPAALKQAASKIPVVQDAFTAFLAEIGEFGRIPTSKNYNPMLGNRAPKETADRIRG
ncbi:MAG: DUF4102 domain-containing protein [Alphaproteobacteria bacterium]|nr:MAG: DUF4102 domain-containing protein [Alphaproteobacteria bacterium]